MAIACNTAHIFAGSVRKHTAARFINIIEATVEEAARHECQYLILSSSTTRKTGLYNDALLKKKIDFLDIDDSEQKIVDQIISLVMYNKIFEASTLADEFIEGLLIKYTKVKGVIAGCTELPLALSHASLKEKLTIIDCNTALAKKLADEYYAQRLE